MADGRVDDMPLTESVRKRAALLLVAAVLLTAIGFERWPRRHETVGPAPLRASRTILPIDAPLPPTRDREFLHSRARKRLRQAASAAIPESGSVASLEDRPPIQIAGKTQSLVVSPEATQPPVTVGTDRSISTDVLPSRVLTMDAVTGPTAAGTISAASDAGNGVSRALAAAGRSIGDGFKWTGAAIRQAF